MHLLVPFAATVSVGGRQALRTLKLPRLKAWLRQARLLERDDGDELSLSPPHERALARAWGWRGDDGALPFAAAAAQADGVEIGAHAWGQLTPVHWHVGTDQLSLIDPAGLMLDAAGSRTFFDAVAPLFTSEGFEMRFGAAARWYIANDLLATLPSASIDRVIGRNVDRWLIAGIEGRLLRRLQNEVQMLLHAHPLNAEREARGLLAVNSVWISGSGLTQAARPNAATVQLDARLRAPALAEDWAAWCKAWDTLDAAWPASMTRLTLCGERASAAFEPARVGFMNTLRNLASREDPIALLESL